MGKVSPKGIYKNLTFYGDEEFSKYMRRAFLGSAGYDQTDLERPVVGIVDTTSDYNTCHRQMPEMVQAVKRGVLEAGGLPMVFPTISLHEINTSPTTMLFRNLQAMETEEMIKAQPMDSVVLLGGCDKTVPAQCMAAISADVPAIIEVAGPMMNGSYKGERLGACTDCRRLWAKYRAGGLTAKEIKEIESVLCFTGGTCMVMGTAQTMACIAETIGLMLPGGATPPHSSGARLQHCAQSGRAAVELAKNNLTPKKILTRESFLNAVTVLMAVSGSTNVVVHLLAMARRAGIELTLNDFSEIAKNVPVLTDLKPAGKGYMQDLHFAGGLSVLLKVIEPLLHTETKSITGKTLKEQLIDVESPGEWQDTIRTMDNPLYPSDALAVVYGSLAPNGAIIKAAAASQKLMVHRGPAVVFESPEDAAERIDDPSLNITPDHVMVLRNGGPVAAGMPESGSLPIPKYLAQQGVKDMVRVSDARMSGTAYGTIVLHCSPEAAVGGPIGMVKDGDIIELNVPERRIDLIIDGEESEKRKKALKKQEITGRGWKRLYKEHVLQAHLGADLDFL
ncbi:MAG TPA: dihydroxy-acid dehydratase [Victivallales bacterium]|nr:dihydroxy-acid dehydratase [Victivallales bacterium]